MKKLFQLIMILCLIATYMPIDTGTTNLAFAEEETKPDGTPAPEEAEPECD